jgi:hypothetical protein
MPQSYLYFPCSQAKTVTIVAHGLNNKPAAMMAFVETLLAWGSDVFLLQLSGHTLESSKMPLSGDAWIDDLYQTYQQAIVKARTSEPKPLYFLGYSLGALVNLHLITLKPGEIVYDKMVLLAPALSLRIQLTRLLQLATGLFPAHFSLPVKAYSLLYKMALAVEKSSFKSFAMPVLVIIDPKDEMVSYKKLAAWVAQLPSWQLYTLPKSTDVKSPYAHLILDEHSVGRQNWVRMLEQIKQFLDL